VSIGLAKKGTRQFVEMSASPMTARRREGSVEKTWLDEPLVKLDKGKATKGVYVINQEPIKEPMRRKLIKACNACRMTKLRCDGTEPTCKTCDRRGVACTWRDDATRGTKEDYVKAFGGRMSASSPTPCTIFFKVLDTKVSQSIERVGLRLKAGIPEPPIDTIEKVKRYRADLKKQAEVESQESQPTEPPKPRRRDHVRRIAFAGLGRDRSRGSPSGKVVVLFASLRILTSTRIAGPRQSPTPPASPRLLVQEIASVIWDDELTDVESALGEINVSSDSSHSSSSSSDSGESDDTEPPALSDQQTAVLGAVLQEFTAAFEAWTRGGYTTRPSNSQGSAPRSGFRSIAALPSASSSVAPRNNKPSRKRRASRDEDEDEDDEDCHRSKRANSEPAEPAQRLACHFFKRDPLSYREERSCVGPGWRTVHRVK
jgi:hypothetical protein